MAHLFNAGMALRPEGLEDHEVREESAAAGDIFVDAAAASESGQEAPPCDAFNPKRPNRWGLAVCSSLALHLVLSALFLFAASREQTLPSLDSAKNRVIIVSLVEMPTLATGSAQPSAPPPSPASARKPSATPKPATTRSRYSTKTQLPAPQTSQRIVAEAAPPDGVSDNTAPAAERASLGVPPAGDQGSQPDGGASPTGSGFVQASVPLYELNPPPVYPAAARRRNLQGTVLLEVLVDRQGRAAQVRVLHGSGHEMLDRSALDSVRKWRFRPALRGGRPQEMWVQVPVRFRLQ